MLAAFLPQRAAKPSSLTLPVGKDQPAQLQGVLTPQMGSSTDTLMPVSPLKHPRAAGTTGSPRLSSIQEPCGPQDPLTSQAHKGHAAHKTIPIYSAETALLSASSSLVGRYSSTNRVYLKTLKKSACTVSKAPLHSRK